MFNAFLYSGRQAINFVIHGNSFDFVVLEMSTVKEQYNLKTNHSYKCNFSATLGISSTHQRYTHMYFLKTISMNTLLCLVSIVGFINAGHLDGFVSSDQVARYNVHVQYQAPGYHYENSAILGCDVVFKLIEYPGASSDGD